jgi:hypothetical protein
LILAEACCWSAGSFPIQRARAVTSRCSYPVCYVRLSRLLSWSASPLPNSNSDIFSRGITALIGVPEIGGTIPSRPANRISKQTRLFIREVVWPVVVPIIAVWETLDFRPSRAQPKEQKAGKDCRENSQHWDDEPLEPSGVYRQFWPDVLLPKVDLDCPLVTARGGEPRKNGAAFKSRRAPLMLRGSGGLVGQDG